MKSMQAALGLYYLLEIRIQIFLITWKTNLFFIFFILESFRNSQSKFKYYMNNSFYSLYTLQPLVKAPARIPSSGKLIWSLIMTLISQCLEVLWPTWWSPPFFFSPFRKTLQVWNFIEYILGRKWSQDFIFISPLLLNKNQKSK